MSFMDRKNILSEGLVDFILKAIFKKSYSKFKKHIDDFDKNLAKASKELGLDD